MTTLLAATVAALNPEDRDLAERVGADIRAAGDAGDDRTLALYEELLRPIAGVS